MNENKNENKGSFSNFLKNCVIVWLMVFAFSFLNTTSKQGYHEFCSKAKEMALGGLFIDVIMQNTDSTGFGMLNPVYAGKKAAIKQCVN